MSKQIGSERDDAVLFATIAAIRAMQGATHEVDRQAARSLGINQTDLSLLGHLEAGPLAPKDLARLAHITPASTTTAMGRLDRAGWITRQASAEDGRSVLVSLTEAARAALDELYGPIRREGMHLLGSLSPDELSTIRRFLERSAQLQREQAERIAAGIEAAPRGRSGGGGPVS